MQPLSLKKARFDLILKILQTSPFVILFVLSLVNSSNSSSKASFFLFSASIAQPINNLLFFPFRPLLRHTSVI